MSIHPPSAVAVLPFSAAHILSAIDPATGRPLDDFQVKAEVATFMAAGFETTSHAITWCLTLLVGGGLGMALPSAALPTCLTKLSVQLSVDD